MSFPCFVNRARSVGVYGPNMVVFGRIGLPVAEAYFNRVFCFGRIGLPVAEAYFNRVFCHLASFTELFVSDPVVV